MAARRIAGITIEIGGDTTKLEKALSGVNKTISGTQRSLKDVNGLLKFDPKNTELLAQKQEYLKNAVDATKEKLEKEKTALAQMKANSTTDEVTEEQKALEREIISTQTELQQLTKEYKEFGTVGGQQIQQAGKDIQNTGKKMSEVGSTMTTHVTVPIVTGFAAAVKTAADFDAQMSSVQAITGATGEDMDTLKSKAREMGSKTKFSATEAAEAMEYMGMAGWKTTDIVDGLEGIMNLAAASGENLGTTSDIVTDGLTAFGLSAEDAGKFANVMAAASVNANTNVSMLGESFKYAAPVAGAMGYSVEDVSIALGLMANSGIKASNAGTSLRTLLTNMAKPTETVANAMDDLGISLDDGQGNMKSFREVMTDLRKGFGQTKIPADELQSAVAQLDMALENGEITEKSYNKQVALLMEKAYGAEGALKAKNAAAIAGKQGMSGLLAIVNASEEDFEKLATAIDTSSDAQDGYNGTAEKMAAVMQDNLQGQLTILMSQLQELAISFGEIAMPVVKEFVGILQGAVEWFNKLSPATKETIAKVAALAAAIGPLLLVGGKVTTGIGTVITWGGKLMGMIGAGGAVAGAAGGAAAGGGLIAGIGGLITAAAPLLIGGAVVAGIVAGGVAIYKNWDKIKETAGKVASKVKEKWNDIKTATGKAFNNIKSTVSTAVSNVASTVKTKFDSAKKSATEAMTNMATKASSAFSTIKTWAAEKAAGAIDKAKSAVSNLASKVSSFSPEGFKSAASAIMTSAKEKIMSAFDSTKEKLKSLGGDLNKFSLKSFLSTMISTGKTLKENIADKMSGVKETIMNIKDALSNFQIHFPSIQLPHFSLEYGSVTILGRTIRYPKGFNVAWYKKAYDQPVMFTSPTVLQTPNGYKGFGDGHGGEIVLSDQKLREIVGSSGATYTVNVYGTSGQNVNELADAVQRRLIALERRREAAGLT